jgi:outer membrane receptor protein involved in Fe transport
MSQKKKSPESQFPLAPLAAAVSAAIVNPVDALAQDESETILEEVIVTGTKMEANIQNVAFDIQALPESMLRDIGAQVTEDYARFVPAINWLNFNGGGENFLIFRGINTTTGGFTQTQSSSIYLDEIPITATDGTQPDIRMMDIERVEALAGPQGTLFGAAAQAGILRIITNKPDTEMFDANAEVMLRTGEDSDPSYQGTAMLNLPLVKDKFAIRIAAQFAEDGGYIDNVPGHTPDTWWGEHRDDADWGVYRQGWGTYRNDVTAEENWNSATSLAIRISARWDINEDWSATLTYHEGDTKSEGNNAYNPFVGDLETIGFVKNTSHSEWDMTGLVFEGDLGNQLLRKPAHLRDRQYDVLQVLQYKIVLRGRRRIYPRLLLVVGKHQHRPGNLYTCLLCHAGNGRSHIRSDTDTRYGRCRRGTGMAGAVYPGIQICAPGRNHRLVGRALL